MKHIARFLSLLSAMAGLVFIALSMLLDEEISEDFLDAMFGELDKKRAALKKPSGG